MKTRALILLSVCFSSVVFAADKPKYASGTEPLSKRTNAAYFKASNAPDFWALIPYYTQQILGQQCSAANFTMVLNAARAGKELKASDELVSIKNLLEKYTDDRYKTFMGDLSFSLEHFDRSNVGNERLTEVLGIAVKKLGIQGPGTKVEMVLADMSDGKKGRKQFHDALVANEKSADDFMILSFVQGVVTGDPEGPAHVATVGAYDAKKGLVLLFDPDRQWYEPYWAPEETVFKAVFNKDADAKAPGWIYFKVR